MITQIYLSRRNLQTLLSKLDRQASGEPTACTIIKFRNSIDPYTQIVDEENNTISITAVEDELYYANRKPGEMLSVDILSYYNDG